MARPLALAAALAASLLAVALLAEAGAGGAPAQTPKRGGTLVISTSETLEPACLNPLLCLGASSGLLGELFAGAFEVTPAGVFRPDLVSRAEIVSKQPQKVRFHIRPEARWSDGRSITASDFSFTHRVVLTHLPGDDLSRQRAENVTAIRELDAKTVEVLLRNRDPDWRYLFSAVLPRHALRGADFESVWGDAVDNPRTGEPIGSGPFLVQRFERGKQLTLVRNTRYWGSHPAYLDHVELRYLPLADLADALRRGDTDMIETGAAMLHASAIDLRRRPAPGVRVLSYLPSGYEVFTIRVGPGGHPALKRKLVRQALAYAIDRVEIARAAWQLALDREAAARPMDSVVFLTNTPYYRPNWSGYRRQPERARRLLEQAGCHRDQDDIYRCAGERLALRLRAVAGVPSRERTLLLAAAQLRRLGIEARPEFIPRAVWIGRVLPSGDFDVALHAWISDASTTGPFGIFGCGRENNISGWCDRLVTRGLDRAARTLDRRRRVGLLNRIDARLAEAVPSLPLYQGTIPFAFKASVRGVRPNGFDSWAWNVEDWWLAPSR